MAAKKKKKKKNPLEKPSCPASFHNSVLQAIRQHARSSPDLEICGVLIGRQSDSSTIVNGAIAGEGASQGGAHVTFTQNTWNRIHEEKDKRYPYQSIVGWYHSHPGFGVFLSDHDVFIHEHFFSNAGSLAWVYDPHSDEEGCFGWVKGNVSRLKRFEVVSEGDKMTGLRSEPLPNSQDLSKKKHPKLFPWHRNKYGQTIAILSLCALLAILVGLVWNGFFKETKSKKPAEQTVMHNKNQIKTPAESNRNSKRTVNTENSTSEKGGQDER